MNNKFIALLLAFSFVAATINTSAAMYTTSKSKVVSIDPFDLINAGRINATYERKISAKNSFCINGSFWSFDEFRTAFGIGGAYRWYFDLFEEGKSSMNGLSVAPRLDLYYWSESWNNHLLKDESYPTLALGAEVNYKWVFSDKWVIEPTIKLVFPVLKKSGHRYTNHGFGINLGYAF